MRATRRGINILILFALIASMFAQQIALPVLAEDPPAVENSLVDPAESEESTP